MSSGMAGYFALTDVAAASAKDTVSPGRGLSICAMRDFIHFQNSFAQKLH
jgi:hypothetical protein